MVGIVVVVIRIRQCEVLNCVCLRVCVFVLKIKRCGEMARKLRFFKEQMEKVGVSPLKMSATKEDVKIDDLEVC